MTALKEKFLNRLSRVILSIYLFNEHRGYTYLEKLAEAFRKKFPEETTILHAVEKHARDERKHYELFKAYFQDCDEMPFHVGPTFGYCDQIVKAIFQKSISEIDPAWLLKEEEKFFQLCRAIMITEERGMSQVDLLLKSAITKRDNRLTSIFTVIERDEPSHCLPYAHWLKSHERHLPSWKEKWIDFKINYSLMFLKIPFLVLNPFLPQRKNFPA